MVNYLFAGFIFFSIINLSVLQLLLFFPTLLHPQSKDFIDTAFYLHTREEPNVDKDYRVSAYNLTSLKASSFNASKETKFIVHGFIHNGRRQWLKDFAAALLKLGDYNVLRVDWGKGSFPILDQARANTKTVGEEIAHFVNTLKCEFDFSTAMGHCIGHSLGGYVCTYAGQGIKKLGRITTLDIGAVVLTEVPEKDFLDPSDADFVDTIHTGISALNILPSIAEHDTMGHINIYVNGGRHQTGCEVTLESLLDLKTNLKETLLDLFINEAFCGHLRPISYYIESIVIPSCQWVAYECSSFELFQKGECASCGTDNSKCLLLGPRVEEYPAKSRERVKFFIKTAADPPFCIQHYVVAISTGIITSSESPTSGVITFEIFGNNGSFAKEFPIKKEDHGGIVKSLFIDPVDVGKISSVKLTWKTDDVLGLFPQEYTLQVYYIKVSPLSHYPESVRVTYEVVACLSSNGLSTPIKNKGTKTFPVMTNC